MKLRKLIIGINVFVLVCVLLSSCAVPEEKKVNIPEHHIVSANLEPLVFYSYEEFTNAIKTVKTKQDEYNIFDIKKHYIPSTLVKNLSLNDIWVKDSYVWSEYSIDKIDYSVFTSIEEKELAEMNNTVKFRWVRSANSKELLDDTIKRCQLQELHSGIYYYDYPYYKQPEINIVRSVYWIYDGYMFNVDMPISFYKSNFLTKDGSADNFTKIDEVLIQ